MEDLFLACKLQRLLQPASAAHCSNLPFRVVTDMLVFPAFILLHALFISTCRTDIVGDSSLNTDCRGISRWHFKIKLKLNYWLFKRNGIIWSFILCYWDNIIDITGLSVLKSRNVLFLLCHLLRQPTIFLRPRARLLHNTAMPQLRTGKTTNSPTGSYQLTFPPRVFTQSGSHISLIHDTKH